MKRWKGCILTLLLGLVIALANVQPAFAAPAGDENYTYTVTIYSGKQSDFTSGSGISVDNHKTGSSYNISGLSAGSDTVRITGLEYGDVVMMDAQSCVQLESDSKYYVGGVRESGRDNNTVSKSAFVVDSDRDYVVAYAIKGDMVSYTVNYVDEQGTPLLPSQTYYGAVGDRPVVAFRYIENYLPLTYNLTKVLSADASQNVFTFVYEYIEGGNVQNVVVLNNGEEETIEYEETTTAAEEVTTIIEEDADDGTDDGNGEIVDDPLELVDLDDDDVPLAFQIAEKIAEFVGDNMLACISGSIFAVLGICVLMLFLKKKKKKQDEEDDEEEETEE